MAAGALLVFAAVWSSASHIQNMRDSVALNDRETRFLLGNTQAIIDSGNQIVSEITRYRDAKGSLPATLAELEAALNIKLPPSPLSRGWAYRLVNENGRHTFELSIATSDNYPVLYKRAENPWTLDS